MKVNVKSFMLRAGIQSLLLLVFLFPKIVAAQGTLNALAVNSGGTIIGYEPQGVGWSFVPTANLLVTGISSTAPQVDFWLGTNQDIATYDYTGLYYSGSGGSAPTNFQTVSSLLLSAGQTYFISTQQPNFASQVNLYVYSLNPSSSPYDPNTFSLSPYISQFASYYLSSSAQWSLLGTPPDNSSNVLLGPNFQFQVVPEPTAFEFSILAVGVWLLRKRTVSNSFHARQTH